MTSLVERIKKHGESVKWRDLEIPAWGEPETVDESGKEIAAKPLCVKVKTLGLEEYREWAERIASDVSERVIMIMHRTYDEKGENLLFDPSDPNLFSDMRKNADPMIIGALVAEIMRYTDKQVMRKN